MPYPKNRVTCRRSVLALGIFFPFVAALPASAQTLPPNSSITVEQRIQRIESDILPPALVTGAATPAVTLAERMKVLLVPGVSVAVIHGRKIEWARGFGVSMVGGPPVTANTLFRAGSISKPVAAMAVLRLVQLDKLDLDTDVNQYLRSWKIPANAFTDKTKVTLRELLTHTAGMTVHGFDGYPRGAPVPTLLQVLNGQMPANSPPIVVDMAPGTIWRYSGGGYVVAQQLLNDVTGTPFPKLLHDTVLGPIGMVRSTYEQPLPQNRAGEAATPYVDTDHPVRGGSHIYPEMAPAGLWTTPSDLARFAIELQNSLAGKSNRVLSKAMTHQMLTAGLGGWGLGLEIGGSAEHPYFTHNGADDGFISNLIAYDNGDGVVIMTNSDNGGQLATEIQRTVAHEYGWPDFQPKDLRSTVVNPKLFDGYVGHYKLNDGTLRVVTLKGNSLFERRIGTPDYQLFPESDRTFLIDVDAEFTFVVGDNGRARQLISRQNGVDMTAVRIDDLDPNAVWTDAVLNRIDLQIQTPGTDEALRRLVNEIRDGQPNYGGMSPALAAAMRESLASSEAKVRSLGSLESVTFTGVGPGGADIYIVRFEKGSTEWRVLLTADGKIGAALFQEQ